MKVGLTQRLMRIARGLRAVLFAIVTFAWFSYRRPSAADHPHQCRRCGGALALFADAIESYKSVNPNEIPAFTRTCP
jgi:hypothetical protein